MTDERLGNGGDIFGNIMKLKICILISFFLEVAQAWALAPEQIFRMNKGSIGTVATGSAFGSGVVIKRGVVLTNCHVISGKSEIKFKHKKVVYEASLSAGNVAYDLCLLKIPRLKADPVSVRDTLDIKVGERVYAIGNPKGFELTISEGLVSGLRDLDDAVQIQTTAPISSGSSGGGLFDAQGRLIGVTTSSFVQGQNINFAMPVSLARRLKPLTFVDEFTESRVLTPQLLDALIELYERHDVEELERATAFFESKDSGTAFTAFLRGLTLEMTDRNVEAEIAFRTALKIDENYTPALRMLAVLRRQDKDLAGADVFGRRCAGVSSPQNSFVASVVALCRAEMGDHSGQKFIDEAIAQNPKSSWLHSMKSTFLLIRKDYSGSLEMADAALRLNPKSAWADYLSAKSLISLKQYPEAFRRIDAGLQISPRSSELLALGAILSLGTQDNIRFHGYFERLKDVAPIRAQRLGAKLFGPN